jgi:pimeloyl-ACP methyl ester carboxylesterase
LKFNYTIKGTTGPQLVFIHGFLGSNRQWLAVQNHLRGNYQILNLELPGHGGSENRDQTYSLEEVCHKLQDILVENNFIKPTFIGHSMGGYLAACFCSLYPDHVKNTILINSICGPDPEERKHLRDRSIALIGKFKKAFINMAISNLFTHEEREEFIIEIEMMKEEAHHLTQDSVIHAILAMKNRSGSVKQILKNNAQIYYIYSKNDPIVPAALVEEEVEILRAPSVAIDSGHMSILTHPELIAQLLENQFMLP